MTRSAGSISRRSTRRAHWAYLLGVLVIGTIVMLLLIAWLGA